MRLPATRRATLAYGQSLGLLAVGFAARLALDPLFGANHAYTAFYPVVILAAYFFGAGPAIMSAVLSIVLAYWVFAAPALAWKWNFAAVAPALFFAFTASVSIYFITGMARALEALAEARGRAEDLARDHAQLFGELNDRVANHLQLVAAVLQLQARDESDQSVARALSEASARTLLISRVHRTVAGDADKTLDFDVFARHLLDATLAARGHPPVEIEVERQGLRLPLDQATSVAVVLLECLNARLRQNTPASLRVRLRNADLETILEVSEAWPAVVDAAELEAGHGAIAAMVEQLGGQFSVTRNAVETVSALAFPRPGSVVAAVTGGAGGATFH